MAYIGTNLDPKAHQAFRELSAKEGVSMSKKLLRLALGALSQAEPKPGLKPISKLKAGVTAGEFAASAAGCGASPGVALGGAAPGNARKIVKP